MPRRTIFRALHAAALVCILATTAASQSLLSDRDRRTALRHYATAQQLFLSERFEEAAGAFREATRLDALLTDAHYGLGQSMMALRRYDQAIEALGNCIEAARRVHDLQQQDRVTTDRAIAEQVQELRDSVRRVSSGQIRVVQVGNKVLQLEQRIKVLERSRSSLGSPFEVPAAVLLSLGSAHFRLGDRDAAAQYWQAAVRADSGLGEAWNNLAVIYLGAGEKTKAMAAVERAERAGFRVNPGLRSDIRAMR